MVERNSSLFFTVDFQFHFHRSDYTLDDVIEIMEEKEIDGLGVLTYPYERENERENIFHLTSESGKYTVEMGKKLAVVSNKETGRKTYIFLGKELESSDGWHLLAIGTKLGDGKRHIEDYIDDGLANQEILILDHPFADPTRKFADISDKKERQLRKIIEKYGKHMAFEWNAYCLPWIRACMPNYSDVNSKIERLIDAYDLNNVIPTTDTHARNKRLARALGTSFAAFRISDLDFGSEDLLYNSLRNSIEKDAYLEIKKYVPFLRHFLPAFGWPRIGRE